MTLTEQSVNKTESVKRMTSPTLPFQHTYSRKHWIELWNAKSINGDTIAEGDAVIVRSMEGLCLVVERTTHT